MRRIGIAADVALCRPEGESGEEPRFERVRTGAASPELPPLEIVLWLGDDTHGFPGMSQEVRNAPEAAFPRPVYRVRAAEPDTRVVGAEWARRVGQGGWNR